MISLGKDNDRYMMVGMLSAFIPINIIGSAMSKDPSVKNFDDYYKIVRYAPLFMGILNLIIFNLVGKKYLLVGIIIALILSPLYYMYVARFVVEDIKL